MLFNNNKMEVMAAITNNLNQKELRLYAPNEQQQQQTANPTTILANGGARSPFQREVREWQRIDPDTGALLTGRLEADRWINGPLNKYGKISDSQNIAQPNGTQQTQRKQLELLQTCTAAGTAMQVIRSQTVQTISSRWSTSSASPTLLSASNSPKPQQLQQTIKHNNKHSFKQKTHNKQTATTNSNSPSSTPFIATTLLTNGFNHKPHHVDQLPQYPHCLVNGISRRNRNWIDLTENMSTLDICDNDHDNEHDHDSNYIVQHQSSDEQESDDNSNGHDEDSLIENTNKHNDEGDDCHHHNHQYLLNKRNNLKNVNSTKRHAFTVSANNGSNINTTIISSNHYEPPHHHSDHDSHHNHHNNHSHNNSLSRDSSSGSSCSNNNQLFLLDTAPSLKLSNLMKSSSSLSNSSNNSTTATQTTNTTNTTSMNTHKNLATNKISLHAIVGSNSNHSNNNNNNNNSGTKTATTTSSTPSPTFPTSTTRPSWQQPSIYRQNSHNYRNNKNLMKSRVGDTNNCCSSSSGDESRSYEGKTEADLCHLQRQSSNQQQHQIHIKQNDRLTPTHSRHSYHRVDLESFRHYSSNDNTTNNNNDTDDDGLRLSSRHLRRQQIPNELSINSLQRYRSISIDDLSTEWDIQGVGGEEPAEWRRVSKLRSSFQSTTKNNQSIRSPTTAKRPLDLPTNSVSVSKIRAELENGRRLNTVMRNNHVDLAALSSILNGSSDKETKSSQTPKRNSFLTAESLKEIRGKLKKLSDESLYKEDFLMNQQSNDANPEFEHIVNDQTKFKRNYESSPDRYSVTNKADELNNKHTTNSLESRLKYRDTNSTDWHLRRKSYGFEKMSPPEKEMLRIDASTDSGLGRSGELQSWSPTAEAAAINRTVVHFGETAKVTAAPIIQRRYRPQKSYEESENSPDKELAVSKRHSIAVDESNCVRDSSRRTTQIHINGLYEPAGVSKSISNSESTINSDKGQQKRVEFSKTEVHFATESGRVNIVETDSKPPPNNNFRRRRSRSSTMGPLHSLVQSASTVSTANTLSSASTTPTAVVIPVTLFSDDNTIKKTMVAYRAPLVGSPEPKDSGINVTVTIPSVNESFAYTECSRSNYASTSGVDTTDCDTDEITSLRGILKNKPAKPKPYVLGENIDKPDDLWGVQLKPVTSNQTKNEKVLKPASPTLLNVLPQKSVAERIQELGSSSAVTQSMNGFSTKINVSLGNTAAINNNWEETGLTTNLKYMPTVQELLMQDLKKHQKILDEGLKSTTLIIKTMRSATEFDKAMRRLSMTSIQTDVVKPTATLTTNSYQESTTQSFDNLQPNFSETRDLYKSPSFSSTSSWSTVESSRKYLQDSRKNSTDSGASFTRNDSMRNEELPVSQQLQRLRLIYDATISQDEDSADEEVKRYFKGQVESDSGGGTQDSSSYEDDHCLEHTNSWSRLKAKKTIWKIEADKDVERILNQPWDKTELPKSNVMSIKLHSPQSGNEVQPPLKVVPPIAKPRNVTTIQEPQATKTQTPTCVKQASFCSSLPTKDSLKIIKEARGARQLREHELCYFGVPLSISENEKPKSKYTSSPNFRNSPKRSLPNRKLHGENSFSLQAKQREQWQLDNDKPDLLKHNPIKVKPAERTSLNTKAELNEDEEHLYENIANDITPVFKVKSVTPPEQYNRKMDLKRDAMILSEMNKNADQTLRELSDEAALRDRRRRSLQRRNSKPLETIDEKSIAERINDTCIAVNISRGTYASEAKKTSRHSTPSPTNATSCSRERTSSQSSIECCPRARSRSLSSEKEYDAAKPKPSRSTQMIKHKPHKLTQNHSCCLDSQKSGNLQYSSGDEQQRKPSAGSFRREDRSRTKTKRITSSASSGTRNKHKDDKISHQSAQQQQNNHHNHHGDSKRLSSTTHSSFHRERVECKHDNNTTGATTSQQHRHNNCFNPGLQRSTATTSSGRRQKNDLRDSQKIKRSSATASGRSTSERNDKNEQTSSKHATRSIRDDERNSSQRLSSHRLERDDKENEKSSRSTKNHSSRSTSHHHHDRSTISDNKYLSTRDAKTKSANPENTTSSKNVQHHHHQSQQSSKERYERQHQKAKRDEDHTEHVHGLKSALIKTTTKLRDKSRSRKEKK